MVVWSGIQQTKTLTLFKDNLYWVDSTQKQLVRANKNGQGSQVLLANFTEETPASIKVFAERNGKWLAEWLFAISSMIRGCKLIFTISLWYSECLHFRLSTKTQRLLGYKDRTSGILTLRENWYSERNPYLVSLSQFFYKFYSKC